jgi:hypothetical protein
LAEETEILGENLRTATFSTETPIRYDLGSNTGHSAAKPTADRPNCGIVFTENLHALEKRVARMGTRGRRTK